MVGVLPSGKIVLHQGAVDIGQGSNTVMTQILADALSVSMDNIIRVGADTNSTPDAGKTSASRQTFVSGKATYLAGIALRKKILQLADADESACAWSRSSGSCGCHCTVPCACASGMGAMGVEPACS